VKDLKYSYLSICQQIPDEVRLLAVSKTRPAEDIETLFNLGQREFAENQVQEALLKMEALSSLPITWHFIGLIQTNKTKAIATHFDWVHTVCREKEAIRLNDQHPVEKAPLQVCLQINIGKEPQKNGLSPDEIMPLADLVESQLKNLKLRGLMCIPPADGNSMPYFKQMFTLYEALRAHYPQCDTLSIGMSHDMMAAIAAGSTCVRIGQALFGARGE
jgi:PLP dependent protein